MKYYDEFVKGKWNNAIDVENFIELNYKEYLGEKNFYVNHHLKQT